MVGMLSLTHSIDTELHNSCYHSRLCTKKINLFITINKLHCMTVCVMVCVCGVVKKRALLNPIGFGGDFITLNWGYIFIVFIKVHW